ncbi:MAG: flagellin [Planctomycetes bacterium]|nr:flagellin [Planctomycetota bacterium]
MSLHPTNGTSSLLRALHRTQTRMDRTFTHLATGKRIAKASDDAAGLAIGRRLEAEVRGLSQGERNLADGMSYVQTAEGSLQSHHDTLGRMRELSVQARNGTLSDGDRAVIQQEYDQLAASLDQTADGARFGDQNLLDGSASGSGAPSFTDGSGEDVRVEIGDMDSEHLGVRGRDVADPETLDAIDAAIDDVSRTRASLGATHNRMAYRAESVATMRVNAEESRSRIEDADYAKEVADLTRDRILLQMQVSGLVRSGQVNKATLDLLG